MFCHEPIYQEPGLVELFIASPPLTTAYPPITLLLLRKPGQACSSQKSGFWSEQNTEMYIRPIYMCGYKLMDNPFPPAKTLQMAAVYREVKISTTKEMLFIFCAFSVWRWTGADSEYKGLYFGFDFLAILATACRSAGALHVLYMFREKGSTDIRGRSIFPFRPRHSVTTHAINRWLAHLSASWIPGITAWPDHFCDCRIAVNKMPRGCTGILRFQEGIPWNVLGCSIFKAPHWAGY